MCRIPRYLEGSHFKISQGDKSVGKLCLCGLISRTYLKSRVWQHGLAIPALGTQGQEDPWGSLADLFSQVSELKAQ